MKIKVNFYSLEIFFISYLPILILPVSFTLENSDYTPFNH